MSRWRKIALDALPSCKSVVELSPNPVHMWVALAFQYAAARECQPPDIPKMKEIVDFVTQAKYLPSESYLRTGIEEFEAVKKGSELMLSWRDFLRKNVHSDRFFIDLWDQFFSICSREKWNVSTKEWGKLHEAFQFADWCSGPWLPTRHSKSVIYFTRGFVEQFAQEDPQRAAFLETFTFETTFEDWMVASDLDKEQEAKAWTTYWATRKIKWPR